MLATQVDKFGLDLPQGDQQLSMNLKLLTCSARYSQPLRQLTTLVLTGARKRNFEPDALMREKTKH